MKVDTHYTDYWHNQLNLTEEQEQVVSMYSGMFALEFSSTMGHTFNKEKAEARTHSNVLKVIGA